MTNWNTVKQHYPLCHTKAAWDDLFRGLTLQPTSPPSGRLLRDVFRRLQADPCSARFGDHVWTSLLRACASIWDIELGRAIAEHCANMPRAAIAIEVCRMLRDSGNPAGARQTAKRALRLRTIDPILKLELHIAVATSYGDEGRVADALRVLIALRSLMDEVQIASTRRADLYAEAARVHFTIGGFGDAAASFERAAHLYLEGGDTERACRALFNAAASLDNFAMTGAGRDYADRAEDLVKQCFDWSRLHTHDGSLAACEGFIGLRRAKIGDWHGAILHMRRALDLNPQLDGTRRSLHWLSLLGDAYFQAHCLGQARRTLERSKLLGRKRKTHYFHSRFMQLESQLLWEGGELRKAHELAVTATARRDCDTNVALGSLGIQAELLRQHGLLRTMPARGIPRALESGTLYDEDLMFCAADAFFALCHTDLERANHIIDHGVAQAEAQRSAWGQARFRYLRVLWALASGKEQAQIAEALGDCEEAVARVGERTAIASLMLAKAAFAYRGGAFEVCVEHLNDAKSSGHLGIDGRLAVETWLACIAGAPRPRVCSLSDRVVNTWTRLLFAPRVRCFASGRCVVGEQYEVTLPQESRIAELIDYLVTRSEKGATLEELLERVWRVSPHCLGGSDRIVAVVRRLRLAFPYTMVPVVRPGWPVVLDMDAIAFERVRTLSGDSAVDAIRLVRDEPLSIKELGKRLAVSHAKAKRIVRALVASGSLTRKTIGRNVKYEAV